MHLSPNSVAFKINQRSRESNPKILQNFQSFFNALSWPSGNL